MPSSRPVRRPSASPKVSPCSWSPSGPRVAMPSSGPARSAARPSFRGPGEGWNSSQGVSNSYRAACPMNPSGARSRRCSRKRGRFVVADDAWGADIVFVVQVQGGASFSGLQVSAGPRRPAPLTFGVGALDTPAGTTTPVRLLAVAVRGAVWRGGARDATSLLQGRVWDGTEHAVGSQAVSPDALVEAFSKHPDRPYPPSRQAGRPPMFDELPPEPGSTLNDQQPPRLTTARSFLTTRTRSRSRLSARRRWRRARQLWLPRSRLLPMAPRCRGFAARIRPRGRAGDRADRLRLQRLSGRRGADGDRPALPIGPAESGVASRHLGEHALADRSYPRRGVYADRCAAAGGRRHGRLVERWRRYPDRVHTRQGCCTAGDCRHGRDGSGQSDHHAVDALTTERLSAGPGCSILAI